MNFIVLHTPIPRIKYVLEFLEKTRTRVQLGLEHENMKARRIITCVHGAGLALGGD